MKLKDLEIFVVAPPFPGWGGRYWIFPKLTTDTGIIGYGECYASTVGPKAMQAVIEDVFERHMQGENPENIETDVPPRLFLGLHPAPRPHGDGGLFRAGDRLLGHPGQGAEPSGLGASWRQDERADPLLHLPLPRTRQGKLPEFWVDPDAAAEAAVRFMNQGFTAVKFDPAGPYTIRGGHEPAMSDITRSIAFCKAIREAVGDRVDLLFGTHGQFTTPGAIRMGRELEPYNPLWYEEPIPPDNLLEFAEVAKSVRVPLATGERMTTKAEFGTLLRAGGVKILQPALGRVGGIWEAKKIAAMAEIFNAEMAPHLYAGPVEWAANVHFAASIPNLLIAETIETGGAFHLKLIRNSIKWEDGYIIPPDAPGLGIDFDEDLARAHPFTGTGLHLQMQEAPCDYRHGNRFEGGAPSAKT